MSDIEAGIPEGYTLHDFYDRNDFAVQCGPFYTQPLEGGVRLALRVEPRHCNLNLEAHGGFIASMADVALGVCLKRNDPTLASLATLELSIRYFAAPKIGNWLCADARVDRMGRTIGFAHVDFSVGEQRTAYASTTCKLLTAESMQRRREQS